MIKKGLCIAFGVVIGFNNAYAMIKHETEVFGKWLAWQQIYYDRNIADVSKDLNDDFITNFKNQYKKNIPLLKPLTSLLNKITEGQISNTGFLVRTPIADGMRNQLSFIYENIENNMPAVIEYLANGGMASRDSSKIEESQHFDVIIEKYKAFSRLLFPFDDTFKQSEYLLAFANCLFEYCFSDETFPHYQNIVMSYDQHSVVRCINALMWYYLVGDGWKHWHANTLDGIAAKAAQGNEVVYIAGGTDFYHLLRNGVTNITIIDPFLPTQARFYSEGWEFLISPGALNSEIRFGPSCNSIKMKCVDYCVDDKFHYKLSNNQILSVDKGVITWFVYDRNNNHIGHVIINRRPVTQQDLADCQGKVFVMSYDELTCLAAPELLHGWGIDPTQFPDNIKFYVKQIRKPVGKNTLCAMRIFSMLNLSDVRFINLASDPT